MSRIFDPRIFDPVVFDASDGFEIRVRVSEDADTGSGFARATYTKIYSDTEPVVVPWQNLTVVVPKALSTLTGAASIIPVPEENRVMLVLADPPTATAQPRIRPSRGRP